MKKLIIFDLNGTLVKRDSSLLQEGCLELLRVLNSNCRLVLVTLDKLEPRKIALTLLGNYFEEIYFVEQKTEDLFKRIVEEYAIPPHYCYVIGDTELEEISIGKKIGCKTIFIHSENKSIIADYSIKRLAEIGAIL